MNTEQRGSQSHENPLRVSVLVKTPTRRMAEVLRRPREALVAEDVRGIVMGEIDDTTRRLLREMGYLAEGKPTPEVAPREAAENLELDPSSPEYRAALDHLVALGDIKRGAQPDPAGPAQDLYQLTEQGFRRATEIRWY